MGKRQRYKPKTISQATVTRLQRDFLRQTGPSMKLMWELADSFPDIALTVKNREGRIVFTNRFNASISGWSSPADQIGYTSAELYPPDQATVYGGRDREVMETGVPIIERIYGFVADRSTKILHYPLTEVKRNPRRSPPRIPRCSMFRHTDSFLCL